MIAPPTHRTTAYAVDLAAENGRLRYDRDLLLRQIEAIHNGLQDGSAPYAWSRLKAIAAWMRETDAREGTR
jgi:hypothetical protein